MDDHTDTAIRERMAFEGARTGLPNGFPKMPDLPVSRYTNAELYRQEFGTLFRRTWLFAGHVSELPRPGSYRVLELPFAPVVLTRSKDGHIHALLNACRHRGAPVVREACGTAKKLVCQYHSWAYDLDGQLVHTPQPRDFAPDIKEGRGLGSLRCEVQNGFVFVNFDHDAPSLAEYTAPLARRFGDLASEEMRLINRKSYDIGCNWKFLVEAFLESYHVETIHPNTASAFLHTDRSVMTMHPYGHSAMLIPYKEALISGNEEGDTHWSSSLPTMPGASSFYIDNSASLFAFPNVIVALDPAGYPVMNFWPTAIDRTRLDVAWYGVAGDGAEGEINPEWAMRQAGFDILTDQDIANLEPMQASVEAATHEGVPLSYQERRIWQFHHEIDRLIDTSRLSEDLLMPDLLADYIED
jgi:phenylpropionate dioxygenase-like ring-hydroxylating dioxygenase large terminal subunit